MALSNAERQRRWREKRNDQASDLVGAPDEIVDAILDRLGVDQAKKVVRALDKRIHNIKPDCASCEGTGFAPWHLSTACGMPISNGKFPCDCSSDPMLHGMKTLERRNRQQRQRERAKRSRASRA